MGYSSQSSLNSHLDKLQNLTLNMVAELQVEYFKELSDKLHMLEDSAVNNNQQWALFAEERVVKKRWQEICLYFEGYLVEGFDQFKKGTLGGKEISEIERSLTLALVGDEEYERDIAINSLVHCVQTTHSKNLYALDHRVAIINGGKKIKEDGNPMGPYQFSGALEAMLMPLDLETRHLVIFCRIFDYF